MNTRIKKIREKKGIGQVELAKKSKVSRTVISQLENGKRDIITSDTMKEITKTLKIDSNIEEIQKRVEELADLINKANSIIEELAETELKVKLKI